MPFPPGKNLCGIVGATFAHVALRAWGLAAFLIPIITVGFVAAFARGYRGRNAALRLTGCLIIIPSFAGLIHMIPENMLVTACCATGTNRTSAASAAPWVIS